MAASRIKSLLLLWFAPILIGVACAGYEFAVFRMLDTGPGAMPAALGFLPALFHFFGAAIVGFLFARAVRPGERFRPLIAVAAGLLCFVYIWLRSMTVDSALIGQLGYACCVEDLSVWPQTIMQILNPAFGLM